MSTNLMDGDLWPIVVQQKNNRKQREQRKQKKTTRTKKTKEWVPTNEHTSWASYDALSVGKESF